MQGLGRAVRAFVLGVVVVLLLGELISPLAAALAPKSAPTITTSPVSIDLSVNPGSTNPRFYSWRIMALSRLMRLLNWKSFRPMVQVVRPRSLHHRPVILQPVGYTSRKLLL